MAGIMMNVLNNILQAPVVPVTSNLQLYYDPNNISSYPGSGTTLFDLSGNGLNGTMSNITYSAPYLTFNGTSSTVSVADNALLEPGSGDWTMEAWVYYTTIAGAGRIVMAKTDGGLAQDWGYGLRTGSNAVAYAEYGNGTTSTTTNGGSVVTGQWYQLVGVFTNVTTNTMEFYINTVSQGNTPHSFTSVKNTTSNLYLGSFNNGQFAQWFNGRMGIVRIYNRSLSSTEVLQNYNANRALYGL